MKKLCFITFLLILVVCTYNCSSGISEDSTLEKGQELEEMVIEKTAPLSQTKSTYGTFYYITGRVLDCENSQPLIGCNVVVKCSDGKQAYAIADIDGAYALALPSSCYGQNAIISFSFSGKVVKTMRLPSQIIPGVEHTLQDICLEDDVIIAR